MAAVCFMVTLVLYIVGTVSFLSYSLRRSEALSHVSLGVTAVGFMFHTITLVIRMTGVSSSPPPSFSDALSFFSWMIILVFLVVEFRHHIHVLGSFMVPSSP
jgi:ABC-type uncharacterized transport system permease subunit